MNTFTKAKRDAMLAHIKQELKTQVDGRVLVKEDKTLRPLLQRGIHTYNIYYDDASEKNIQAIRTIIGQHGINLYGMKLVRCVYEYVITFRVDNDVWAESSNTRGGIAK